MKVKKIKTDEEWIAEAVPEPEAVRALKKEIADLKSTIKKQETTKSLFKFAISESLVDLPKIAVPSLARTKKRSRDEIAVLHVSDTQIGKVTTTYNSDIANERLMLLAEKCIDVISIRRSAANINELHLYLGGDIVEGEDIFPGQSHEIDQSVFDQAVRTAPLILARMILRLLGCVKKIKVKTVPGNHGRNGRFASGGNRRTNWDNVVYETLRYMLLGYAGNERQELTDRLEFDIAEDFYIVDRIYDWGCLLVHGDQITGGFAGFPWYGTAKKAWGWIDSIEHPWDFLWFGHFHTPASAVLNHRIFLANGTTESDNAYAQAQLAAAGWPCQRLAFFNEKHGLVADGMLYLTDARKPNGLRWKGK